MNKDLIGKKIRTKFGLAKVKSVTGRYAVLSYPEGGIGWIDIEAGVEIIE